MSSMLNLPGELLKSGVNNVVSGGRRLVGKEFDGEVHLAVKGSTPKDAISVTKSAIKSGYMMKRNKQGQYHRRYVCTVPHMFLYYFDNEMSDAPHGIIDLELFSKIEIEGDNETIKLAPDDDVPFRPYFLQLKDPEELNDWVASLLRDRYAIVKEERDAYRQLQDQFTGEMEVSQIQMKSSSQDLERLLNDVMAAKKETEEALRYIATALSIIGISEEDMKNLSTTAQYGHALSTYIKDFIQAADARSSREKEEFDNDMLVQEEHIKKLEREILAEQHARQQMEVRYAQDREEAETRINEAVHQMDQTSLNMQMAVAAKTAAEGKCAQLVDQKKLLVKEVKQQRKKIEEMTEQMNALRISYQQLQNQISIPPSPSRQSSSDGGVSRSGSMSLLRTIGGAALHHTSDDSDDEIDPNHGTQGSRSPSVASTTSHDNASGVPEHSPSNLLRTMFASIDHTHTTVKNNSNPLISPDDDMLRPSEESSQAHGIAEGDIGNANPNTMMYDGPDAFENEIAVVEDNSQKEQDKTEDSRAGKLICFRCDGTVEGPKYSTCKCAIPALNREQYEADMESEESAGKKVGNLFKSIGRRASFMAGLK